MIYTEEMRASQARVEATRNIRLSEELPRFTAEEKGELLRQYHPDYHEEGFAVLTVGPNKGDKVPKELAALLQGKSRMDTADVDLDHIQFETDVLVIGGGGAGAAAAIEAARHGAKVLMATKLRIGDANTGMAEGGIQAADKESDSPAAHYLDAIGGGHYKNKPELLAELVLHGPEAIQWLSSLGVLFDKNSDGSMVTTHGGGTSRKRMHACGDYTGRKSCASSATKCAMPASTSSNIHRLWNSSSTEKGRRPVPSSTISIPGNTTSSAPRASSSQPVAPAASITRAS